MLLKNVLLNEIITDIEVDGGKIVALGKREDYSGEIIDVGGNRAFPGLLDIHTHGCRGFDTMDIGHLPEMSLFLAEHGTTSWLPSTSTVDFALIRKVTEEDIAGFYGAQVLGFHLEGPYISLKYKGAMDEQYIKKPDLKEFKNCKNVRLVTLAPELEGSEAFIRECGCTVALGHTDADFETGVAAFEAGAKCLTHTFNAMHPFHHRKPSVIGAAIEKNAYVQVISDGVHLHKSVVTALYRIFGSERMILISDSIRAVGLEDGEYESGGLFIHVKDGIARTLDGTIAGSTKTLFECVKMAIEFGIPMADAFKMASQTPATLLGVDRQKGDVRAGADADIIVVDENMNLVLSMAGGKVYKNELSMSCE